MALLQMVNSVLGKIREERITAINASNLVVTEVIDLINDAGAEILEGYDWSFDVRHDGRFFYPGSQSGTNGTFGGASIEDTSTGDTGSLLFLGDTDAGEVFADIDLAGFRMSHPARARVIATGSSQPNDAIVMTQVSYLALGIALNFANTLHMTPITGCAWTTYCNETLVPSTVRLVLSARHEDRDLALEFVDREIEFDSIIPRAHFQFSDCPEVISVGGMMSTTAVGNVWPGALPIQASETGVGAMIWPVPSSDMTIHYSYRVQHSDLAADADVWANVPKNIIRAIEWLAVQKAYDSDIRNDAEKGARAERQVEKRIARALQNHNTQPNRRRIPHAFNSTSGGNSRRRWASQTITAP